MGARFGVGISVERDGVTGFPGATKDAVETLNLLAMKTALLILLTTAWIASWTGIALGLSKRLGPTAAAVDPQVIAINR